MVRLKWMRILIEFVEDMGGAIMWQKTISSDIKPISCRSSRVCALTTTLADNVNVLIVNVYMPCDDNTRGANYDLFIDTLNSISQIIHKADTPYVLLGGDWNSDMSRTSPQVNALKSSLDSHHLKGGSRHPLSDVAYTYESKSCYIRSTTDHFMFSDNLYSLICEYYSSSDTDNLSDHKPVLCGLDIDVSHITIEKRCFISRSAWYKATDADIDNYMNTLNKELKIHIDSEFAQCRDIRCTAHHEYINRVYNSIVTALCTVSDKCIPRTSPVNGRAKVIPGWNDYVKDKKAIAELWNFIWQQNGKPHHGTIANIMRKTKRDYHYAIRYCNKKWKPDRVNQNGPSTFIWAESGFLEWDSKTHKTGMNRLYILCLIYMYLNQKLCVTWNGIKSAKFTVSNGVRQGGVLSPLLFSVYVDGLFMRLRHSGHGCRIGPHFVGAVGYADNMCILSLTPFGLRTVVSICEAYSNEYCIESNGSKCEMLIFCRQPLPENMYPCVLVNNAVVPVK